jgi:hypothetical protein
MLFLRLFVFLFVICTLGYAQRGGMRAEVAGFVAAGSMEAC